VLQQYAVLVASIRASGTVASISEGLLLNPNNKYEIKKVEIETCGPLYQKWKSKKRLYRKAPESGLKLNVEYADTGCLNGPNVLCLHGAPGGHSDFGQLITYFSRKNVRVIAPNFPDYSLTEVTHFFRHTPEEKTEYLKDFLKAIDINEIDLVVSHSSSVYPALHLWDEGVPKVKSLALINPAGHRRIKAMKPKWFIDGSVRVYLNPLGRWIYRKLGNTILTLQGVPVKINNIDNVLLSATTMYHSEVHKLTHYLNAVKEKRTPCLYVFSVNDKLIEEKIFLEMAQQLGLTESEFNEFDVEGSLVKRGLSNSNVVAMRFQSGGHYAFLKHGAIVNQWIENLLQSVCEKKSLFESPRDEKSNLRSDERAEAEESKSMKIRAKNI
ncbi:DUF1057 domain containing protein-like protein, partial [Dinothrombium tinctorium]